MPYCDDCGCALLIDSAVYLKLHLPIHTITGDFWSRNHFHVHFWQDTFGFPAWYREDEDVSGFLFRCISLEFHPRDSPHTEIPDDRRINLVFFLIMYYYARKFEILKFELAKIPKIYKSGLVMFFLVVALQNMFSYSQLKLPKYIVFYLSDTPR